VGRMGGRVDGCEWRWERTWPRSHLRNSESDFSFFMQVAVDFPPKSGRRKTRVTERITTG
jgi:hypothetical protein